MREPDKAGLWDPDRWREWWLDLHPSNFFEGRVFFVLSIKSEADPLPPWVER